MPRTPLVLVALVVLGACAEEAGPDPEVVRLSCEGGGAADCYTYGYWRETGFFGVPVDLADAAAYYERACDLGELRGCTTVGDMFARGEGVAEDVSRALAVFGSACESGDVVACYRLAERYATGEGVPLDSLLADSLYSLSCENGGPGCSYIRRRDQPRPERPIRHLPYTDEPFILNPDEVRAAAQRAYPVHLRQAGVRGTTYVYLFVNRSGDIEEARIDQSSGNEELDRAALQVVESFDLEAARMRYYKVPVWARFRITFPPGETPSAVEPLRSR